MAEFDVAAAFTLLTDKTEGVGKSVDKLAKSKPIHRQALSGNVFTPAVAPAFAYVEVMPHVPAGRVWNVLGINIFGNDAHTPVTLQGPGGIQSSGSTAAPAANNQTSGLTPIVNYPVGTTFLVSWNVQVSGTSAIADSSNFKLMYAGNNIIGTLPNPQSGTASGQIYYTIPSTGGTFHINTINAATAGTEYGAAVSAVPVSGPVLGNSVLPGTWADIYGGALLPDIPVVGTPSAVLSDVLVSQAQIPSVNFIPDKAVWLHQDETVYALVYSPPANQQLVLTARIAEYRVDEVETLAIP